MYVLILQVRTNPEIASPRLHGKLDTSHRKTTKPISFIWLSSRHLEIVCKMAYRKTFECACRGKKRHMRHDSFFYSKAFEALHMKWRQPNIKSCFSTITDKHIGKIRKGDWLMTTLTSRHMLTRDTLHHKEMHMLLHTKNRNWQSATF